MISRLVDIIEADHVGGHQLRIRFADGVEGVVDLAGLEWRGMLEPLRDPAFFAQVSVDPELGTVTWPNGADLAPEPLYEACAAGG